MEWVDLAYITSSEGLRLNLECTESRGHSAQFDDLFRLSLQRFNELADQRQWNSPKARLSTRPDTSKLIDLCFGLVAFNLGEVFVQMILSDYPSLPGLVVTQLLVVEQQSYTRRTNADDRCRLPNSKFLLGNLGRHKESLSMFRRTGRLWV